MKSEELYKTQHYLERPQSKQVVEYTDTPSYVTHNPYEDKLAMLVCQIKIWAPKDNDLFTVPPASQCLTLRECVSVEVSESAKELVNNAVVQFSRGTVISETNYVRQNVIVGNADNDTQSTQEVKKATHKGELITPTSVIDADSGESIVPVTIESDDLGLIAVNQTKTERTLLSSNHVKIGNRIEIRLGYAYSEEEYKEMNHTDHGAGSKMPLVFTGFVTSVSVSTPLELECTNMAYILDCISAKKMNIKPTMLVKDFLDPGSKHNLLKDTGITLAPESRGLNLSVAGGEVTEESTIADVLTSWEKVGIDSMLDVSDDGKVQLRVGYSYCTGLKGLAAKDRSKEYITYNQGKSTVTIIQFDWDVAEDKLDLVNNDKKYLAIEAHGRTKADQFFSLTVRKKPSAEAGWATSSEGEFDVINQREVQPRKKAKRKTKRKTTSTAKPKPPTVISKVKNPVKLDKYNVIKYYSPKIGITNAQLEEEAKRFWALYNPNGISGSLELFGDIVVKPTDIVGLIDPRNPEKNGYYYVESVDTSFGMNGYRREIKIPYKIASFARPVTIIR